MVLMQAAAFGVGCIDMVQIDFHDTEHLQKESRLSYELGFVGKQVRGARAKVMTTIHQQPQH